MKQEAAEHNSSAALPFRAVAHLKRALYPPSCRVTRQRPGESGEANPAGQNSYVLNRVRSGLFWLSLTVAVGFSVKIFFRRPSINRSSSAISAALLCLPPLWISSSLCINSARVSMTSSKAGALIRHSSGRRRGAPRQLECRSEFCKEFLPCTSPQSQKARFGPHG